MLTTLSHGAKLGPNLVVNYTLDNLPTSHTIKKKKVFKSVSECSVKEDLGGGGVGGSLKLFTQFLNSHPKF